MNRIVVALTLALCALVAVPGQAAAWQITQGKGGIAVAAAAGERNVIRASAEKDSAGVRWVYVGDVGGDVGAPVVAINGKVCDFVETKAGLQGIRCRVEAVKTIEVATGDKNDSVKAFLNAIPLTANGGPGNDELAGSQADDRLYGGSGDDRLEGEGLAFIRQGGPQNPQKVYPVDGPLGAGSDLLSGGPGDDELWGERGADLFQGGSGPDTFIGDASPNLPPDSDYDDDGFDIIDYRTSGAAVKVKLGVHYASIGPAGEGDHTWADVEGVYGSPYADVLNGSDVGNLLAGRGGSDYVRGGAGGDWLAGGPDGDTIIGDAGIDLLQGGVGNDKMVANDGVADKAVDCGPGVELPLADPSDPLIHCEKRYTPGDGPVQLGDSGPIAELPPPPPVPPPDWQPRYIR